MKQNVISLYPNKAMPSKPPTGRLSDSDLLALYGQEYVDQYDPHAVPRMRRMLPFFTLTGRESVVDFGCGNGVLLEIIAPRVREYVGVDFSDAFIRAAERRRDELRIGVGEFVREDIVSFCQRNPRRFDAAFAIDFTEHVYDDQFVRIVSAIRGALTPGAPLYIHTPNADYFMERLRRRETLRPIEGHVAVRNAGEHLALLSDCGFDDVDVRYMAHYLFPASAFHWMGTLPFVGRYFRARLFLTCRARGTA